MSRPESGDGGGFPSEWNDYGDSERGSWFTFDSDRSVRRAGTPRDDGASTSTSTGWSESNVPTYRPNDRVRARDNLTGAFGGVRVPAGTNGTVVSTRDGLFTSYVTVAFENGYTEEVKKSDLKKLGWFD